MRIKHFLAILLATALSVTNVTSVLAETLAEPTTGTTHTEIITGVAVDDYTGYSTSQALLDDIKALDTNLTSSEYLTKIDNVSRAIEYVKRSDASYNEDDIVRAFELLFSHYINAVMTELCEQTANPTDTKLDEVTDVIAEQKELILSKIEMDDKLDISQVIANRYIEAFRWLNNVNVEKTASELCKIYDTLTSSTIEIKFSNL